MFKVTASSLRGYFAFDPARKADLEALDRAIRAAAPHLERHFHAGTPAGSPGMRMKMIGYGKFRYRTKGDVLVDWPVIGVALQKNYISVYLTVRFKGKPPLTAYAGRLGETRATPYIVSFERFDQLDQVCLNKLLAEVADAVERDPDDPVRCKEGR